MRRVRRKTAAGVLAAARQEGRKLTADEVTYLTQPDKQTPERTLAETGAAFLATRDALGLPWNATGKQVGEARAKVKGKVTAAPPAPKAAKVTATFTAADIPTPEGLTKGEYLAACKAFVKRFGVKVAEARKMLAGHEPEPAATFTHAQVEAIVAKAVQAAMGDFS